MLRRDVLKTLAALAAVPTAAWAEDAPLHPGTATPFNAQTVKNRARDLAASDYAPRPKIPREWEQISYDQYRKIWFDPRNALWENTNRPQRLDVFPPGLYYPQGVEINIVEDGGASPLVFDLEVFDPTDQFPDLPVNTYMGYSGLRLRADLRGSGAFSEYSVFSGCQLLPRHRHGGDLRPVRPRPCP